AHSGIAQSPLKSRCGATGWELVGRRVMSQAIARLLGCVGSPQTDVFDPAAVPTISNHRSLPRHVQVGEGALDGLGCTRDGLAEGRVRMDGEPDVGGVAAGLHGRSEEHTSELQSLAYL